MQHFFNFQGFNRGLAGQVHGHGPCNHGFDGVGHGEQVNFTADLQTRTNPWPQSLQCWICSGLHIRREVDLLRLVFGGAAMTRRMASSITLKIRVITQQIRVITPNRTVIS